MASTDRCCCESTLVPEVRPLWIKVAACVVCASCFERCAGFRFSSETNNSKLRFDLGTVNELELGH